MSNFNITYGKGFQIRFQNGYMISVQFGATNYISNRSFFDFGVPSGGSVDCEVAIFDKNDNYVRHPNWKHGDNVKGWVSPEEMLELMNWCASL
jgi:hypothetical protein